MTIWLLLKLAVVVFFLIRFLRGSRLIWGIGLVTVTTALLLDALTSTFGFAEMQAEMGFFYFVVAGGIVGGAAAWLFGLLRPATAAAAGPGESGTRPVVRRLITGRDPARAADAHGGTAFDRRMLYEQIRFRFGPEDFLDLIFDLGLNENDILSPAQPLSELIIEVMDAADDAGRTAELALAVERILTPPPAENLPRLEKLSPDSPPTVLRHFLLAHYALDELRRMSTTLGVDWEQLGGGLGLGGKKGVVRGLLLYLHRRNRTGELIDLLQEQIQGSPA